MTYTGVRSTAEMVCCASLGMPYLEEHRVKPRGRHAYLVSMYQQHTALLDCRTCLAASLASIPRPLLAVEKMTLELWSQ